ncbi:MAG: hypothetical protein QM767_21230 [Anaeromyxobacter sp.]
MTELDGTLAELARLRSGSEPIVSLYLDVRWGDEQQRERVRLFVQDKVRKTLAHYPPGTPGREGLERTLRRIQEYVSGLAGQAYEAEQDGLALFACEGLKLWRTFFFARPFKGELCTDGIPHLTQLARLAEDAEPAIVVAPHQDGADIYHITLGERSGERHVRGYVPRGGEKEQGAGAPVRRLEREAKDERHQEEYIQKARRAALAEVMRLLGETPDAKLILVGPAATLAAFERELPERARERVIARMPRPPDWTGKGGQLRDGVLAEVEKAIAVHGKQSQGKAIDAVVGQSLRGGLAVLGPDDVVQALNQGRVHRLVIEEDFARTGWLCDNCNCLGQNAEAAEVCPYCGGAVRAVQFLGEALVARALAEGAEVELVPHHNKLHSYRGVGAFLRQSSATGLRGGGGTYVNQ